MKKAVFLLKRKPSITHEQFRQHYESIHVPLALKHLGHVIAEYRRSFIQDIHGITNDDAGSEPPSFEYDCITEMRFRTDADFDEWMRLVNDPVIGGEFVADEHNFLDREKLVMTICDEVVSDKSHLQIVSDGRFPKDDDSAGAFVPALETDESRRKSADNVSGPN